jgi:hypothetical protein
MSRSRIVVVALIAVIAVVVAWYGMQMMAPPPADLDLSREKPSAAGRYRVAIAPELEPLEQGRLHSWIVTLRTVAGAPVTDATLTVDGGMPQHGHGLPTQPQSAGHIGEGRYRFDGVRFNMAGWWVLKFTIEAPTGKDAAEFNIQL